MAAASTQAPAGARASRPQPQTTGEPPGGPFERHSRKSARPGYSVTTNFGASVDQPLSAAPGYLRYLDLNILTSGGVSGSASTASAQNGAGTDYLINGLGSANVVPTVTAGTAATNPQVGTQAVTSSPSMAAAVSFIQVKDAYGTPVFTGNGYEMLYLVPLFSGQVGALAASDLHFWPSSTDAQIASGSAASGNGFFHTRIPFEIVPGYGCLAIGNSSLQPALHIQFNALSALYSVGVATAPTGIRLDVDENYWGVPVDDPSIEPPGLGTTLQWTQLTANPTVGASSNQRVQLPRTGGYLTTLILVARDSSGNRSENTWPSRGGNQRIRLYLDGVPVLDESIDERIDKMYEEFGGLSGQNLPFATVPGTVTRGKPAGVIAYSFKASESQVNLGHLDNGDLWLSSTPGSLIEIECNSWGATAGTITAIVGQIVPRGQVQQGLSILA